MATRKKTVKTSVEASHEVKEQPIAAAPKEDIEEVTEPIKEERKPSKISIRSAEERSVSFAEIRENQARREVWLESIRSAIFNKTILLNEVTGIGESAKGVNVVCLTIILPEGIKAIIPYNKVFQNDPMDRENVDLTTEAGRETYAKRQKSLIDGMLGTVIRWIPEEIIADPKDDSIIVVGSRTAALTIDRRTYYLRKNANIKKRGTYRGRIVQVLNADKALVLLGGVEKVVPRKTLTNRYAADLHNIYKPGDAISITVRDVEVDTKTEEVSVMFDCLTGELMEVQRNRNLLSINEDVFAQISKTMNFTDENGVKRTRLYAWIHGAEYPVKITGVPYNRFGIPLKDGDKVCIRITGFDVDGYALGYVRSTHDTTSI